MKNAITVALFIVSLFMVAGADTIVKSSRYKAIKERDSIHIWWWKDPVDSIAKTVNGKLSNVNIKSGANIDYAKMDSTKTLKVRRAKVDTLVCDTLRATKKVSVDTLSTKKITSTQVIVGDSMAIRSISFASSANKLTIHKPIVNGQMVKDSVIAGNTVKINLCDSVGVLNHWASVIVTDSLKSRNAKFRRIGLDSIFGDSARTLVVRDSLKAAKVTATTISSVGDTTGWFKINLKTLFDTARNADTVNFYVQKNSFGLQEVTLTFPQLIHVVDSGINGLSLVTDSLLPVAIRPSKVKTFAIAVSDSGYIRGGALKLATNGAIDFYVTHTPNDISGGAFWRTNWFTAGIYSTEVKYFLIK